MPPLPPSSKHSAFSLIELLVVISIIGLLAVLAIPALSSISQARTVTEAAYQLAGAAELARSEAIARRTYVWLGIQKAPGRSGSAEVTVGLVFSRDGTPSLEPSNVQPLGRISRLGSLDLASPLLVPGSPTDLTTQQTGATFSIGGTEFSQVLLTFTPMGEITTNATPGPADGFTPRVALGLRTLHGSAPDEDNPVDILFEGSTGLPSIHRP